MTTTVQALPLRDYQRDAVAGVEAAWSSGVRRPAVMLCTGGGKTVVFAHLIARALAEGRRPIVLVHREELATQAADKIRSVIPGVDVGIVKAERDEVDAQVVVASVQTLAGQRRIGRYLAATAGARRLVVVDECFPAGTLVGGRPIETLRPGDLVPSWDEETGREVLRPVVVLMRRQPEALVRVRFEDGRVLHCTPNHPLLTANGWCPAGLSRGDSVIAFTDADTPRDGLRELRRTDRPGYETEDRRVAPFWSRLLRRLVPRRLGTCRPIGQDGADEPAARLRPDAGAQPDGRPGDPGQNVGDTATGRTPSAGTWRERRNAAGAATGSGRGARLVDGGRHRAGGQAAPLPLPGGHRRSDVSGGGGSGWGVPFLAGPPSLRPAPGRQARRLRVVDVEILERGCDGTYGGVCPDGAVYNIEVEGTHTYLVNDGIVAHNCHHAAARTWVEVLRQLGCFAEGDTRTVGFTATMSRTDGRGLGDVWEMVVPGTPDVLDMIEAGYLVDPRGVAVTVDGLDLATVARSAGDYQGGQLGEALTEAGAGQAIAAAYHQHALHGDGRPRSGVLFAPTVATAHAFAVDLTAAGIPAETITGETPGELRREMFDRHRLGVTAVLCTPMVLTEGWDAPWCEVAVIARPTESAGLYVQMAGRVLRPFPGKAGALVLDVVGVTGRHALRSITDLTRTEVVPRDGESLAEAAVRTAAEEAEAAGRKPRRTALGAVTGEAVDLFHRSRSVWLQTYEGVWFIPTADWTYFLWPQADGRWKVGRKPTWQLLKRARRETGGWLQTDLELGYAMAWGEADAAANEAGAATLSQRSASWRKRKAPPSEAQLAQLARRRIEVPETITKAEASDLISIDQASEDIHGRRLRPATTERSTG